MALAPISLSNITPPGRPEGPAERLPVPGRPRAEANRPEHSPGRIPVAAEAEPVEEAEAMLRQVDKEVRESREYQLLRAYLPDRDDEDDDDARDDEPRDALPPESELPTPPQIPSTPTPDEPRAASPDNPGVRKGDPLVLDLDGDGLETTGVANGATFDLDGDGRLDRTSFVTGGDAFVALDRNGNGVIDDGRELFGDQNGHANGFAALAEHDDNNDGRIDSHDSVFERLRLFSLNADGSQRLTGLADAGVAAIKLAHGNTDIAINRYDSIAQTGSFVRDDGSEGEAGDLLLGYRDIA